MINGPVRSKQSYDGSQWTGRGDSRFDNWEVAGSPNGTSPAPVGESAGDIFWSAGLLGRPWPDNYSYSGRDGLLCLLKRQWFWNTNPESDSGDTFDIHPLKTVRPHVDWPWNSFQFYQPHDFLEFCQNGPAPVEKHIWLHLTDTDTGVLHPEWNFDGRANYYITFHNEAESPSNLVTLPTPLTDNKWKIYVGPSNTVLSQSGTAPDKDSSGNPIQGTGTYPWNPGYASASTEYNWGGSLDIPIQDIGVGVNGGGSSGQQISQNVPQKVIPLGYRGVVYYRTASNRTTFTFRHYSVDGEDVRYDNAGNVIPWPGFADRPIGGTGTSSMDFVVWVKLDGFIFPPETSLDIKGGQ